MVQKVLDLVCEQFAGCETLAYVDLSTQMVLVTNSSSPESQDTLNAMCRDASLMLKDGTTALSGTDTRVSVFLRSADEPADALCCICGPDTNFAEFLPAAQDCLNNLSSDG